MRPPKRRPDAEPAPPPERGRWLLGIGRRSVITFAVAAVLLLIPWPGFGRGFATLFAGFANGVVAFAGLGGASPPQFSAHVPPGTADDGPWAVALSLHGHDPATDPDVMALDTRILGYTPLAIFVALTLATAVPRRRKLIILAAGLGFLLVRLAVSIGLPISRGLGGLGKRSALGVVAEIFWWVLINPPAMSYASPLLAWWLALTLTDARGSAARAKKST
jgi:hypothetical protein